MRIIGGISKGRTLHFPAGSKERPTSDFLREALLNLIGSVTDKSFLDLFAGSGSVGLEAASRGASKVSFIEKDKTLANIAQKNIETCGLEKKCRVINADVRSGLNDLCKKKCKFDIVFADPPYNKGFVEATINLLTEYPVYKDDALLVIQHSTREALRKFSAETVYEGSIWHQIDQRKYGDNAISFLKVDSK